MFQANTVNLLPWQPIQINEVAFIGFNVFISIFLRHVSHITTCKFLGLEQKHIAYLVLLLSSIY